MMSSRRSNRISQPVDRSDYYMDSFSETEVLPLVALPKAPKGLAPRLNTQPKSYGKEVTAEKSPTPDLEITPNGDGGNGSRPLADETNGSRPLAGLESGSIGDVTDSEGPPLKNSIRTKRQRMDRTNSHCLAYPLPIHPPENHEYSNYNHVQHLGPSTSYMSCAAFNNRQRVSLNESSTALKNLSAKKPPNLRRTNTKSASDNISIHGKQSSSASAVCPAAVRGRGKEIPSADTSASLAARGRQHTPSASAIGSSAVIGRGQPHSLSSTVRSSAARGRGSQPLRNSSAVYVNPVSRSDVSKNGSFVDGNSDAEEKFRQIARSLHYMKINQRNILTKLDDLLSERKEKSVADIENYQLMKSEFMLPCHSFEDVNDLEQRIKDESVRNRLILILSWEGVNNVHKFVRQIMSKLLTCEIGALYSMTGKSKGNGIVKEPFERLINILDSIRGAVRVQDNLHSTSSEDIDTAVANWLRRCPEKNRKNTGRQHDPQYSDYEEENEQYG